MPATTPRDAFEHFAAPLRRAVSLVVPAGRGALNEYPRPLFLNQDHSLSFPQQQPARLTGERVYLDLVLSFRIVETDSELEPFRVTTNKYVYTLFDRNLRELLAYHFHPDGAGWCTYPHLITGSLTLQAFIRLLIEDPAKPVVSLRPDWERVLEVKGDRDAVD